MSFSRTKYEQLDGIIYDNGLNNIDIKTSNSNTKVLINGIEPSAGGGGGGPYDGPGDIRLDTGNLTAVGDGVNDGKIEGQTIKSIGNIVITTGSLEVTTGGVDINGNGNITQTGTGKITSGSSGIESKGDITTIGAHDLVIGKDIYFDGQDIYHRTFAPDAQESYKDFKQLPGKNDPNIFTGLNKFRSNALSIQALNAAVPPVYVNTITLNTNGNIQCDTINNVSEITTGTLVCDNGGTNECKAKVFNTRTSGTNGWNIKQAEEEANPPGNKANNILQIAATQAQVAGIPVEIYITSSEYNPVNNDNPNIKLIPDTVLNGGSIQASQFDLGTAPNRYYLKQDIGGPNDKVLQIRAPASNGTVNFKNSLNADVLVVKESAVDLANNIPLNYGLYSFRPQQYIFNFTGAIINLNPSLVLFNSATAQWSNVNNPSASTQSLHQIGEGYFKMTILGGASSGGTYGAFRFMCDFPFMIPSFSTPGPIRHYDGNVSWNDVPNGGVYPRLCGFSGGGTDFKLCILGIAAGGTETYDGIITITKLDF